MESSARIQCSEEVPWQPFTTQRLRHGERAIGLTTCVNTHITRKEEWFQELVQVVEAHRRNIVIRPRKI